MMGFWVSAPFIVGTYIRLPELISVAYSVVFRGASHADSDIFSYYALLVAPLFVILPILIKKSVTGILTKKDIFLFILFCFLVPLMYVLTYSVIASFSKADFIL